MERLTDNCEPLPELRPGNKFRKSHKKSRNGCVYCKQRRIKCDETKPACGNCTRLSVPCEYSQNGQEVRHVPVRKRGRPRKDWTVVSTERSREDIESTTSSATSHSLSSLTPSPHLYLEKSLHLPWSVEDLELLYHYMTTGCLGGNEQDDYLWRSQLPRLAFRRHSVLHLMLAISALHLARQDFSRSVELLERADAHMAIGLRQATQALADLNEDNCAELYITTILICTCTFAKKPGPRHLLVVSEGHEVAWWQLFRGVRIVVETIGLPRILATIANEAGPDAPKPPQTRVNEDWKKIHIIFGPLDWEDALNCLSPLVERASEARRTVCQSMLGMLKWCFQDTFGTSADRKPTADAKFQTIMAWLYVLDDEFVNMLTENEPIALVLLAHYAVLFQTLESVWFLRGWAPHILKGISEILEPLGQTQWIHWPAAQIENGVRFMNEVETIRKMDAMIAFGSMQ